MASETPELVSGGRGRARLALVTAGATFPLIFAGGLVTSTDSGLSVPDWPTTFGVNMFLFPWAEMVGKVGIEHGHRLLGSLVGLLVLSLFAWTMLSERRQHLRVLAWVALLAVITQGLFGGFRVTLASEPEWNKMAVVLAVVHGCTAQGFFCLISAIALIQSERWARRTAAGSSVSTRLALAVPALIFTQLVFGAVLRHLDRLLHLHMAFAVLVTAVTLWLCSRSLTSAESDRPRAGWARAMAFMVVFQVLLGVGSWLVLRRPELVGIRPLMQSALPTLHVATGAMLLLSSVLHALLSWRSEPLGASGAETAATERASRVVAEVGA